MATTVTAYQPRYFPRLHYFARAREADVFIIYDDVEFSRRSRQHRAPIDFRDIDWLTVPIEHGGDSTTIKDARIDMSTPWPVDHLETLVHKYGACARELAHYYENLLPNVPKLSTVRNSPDEVRNELSGAGNTVLEELRRRDEDWQRYREKQRSLESRKDRLGEQIANARSGDDQTESDDLIAESREISRRLTPIQTKAKENKRMRNEALLALSDHLKDDADVERMDMREMWDLDHVKLEDSSSSPRLVDLTVPLLEELLERFEIETRIVRSSDIAIDHPGDPSEYLSLLTASFDGDRYLSGLTGYENYIDEDAFATEGIEVVVQDWEPSWDEGNVCALNVLFAAEEPAQYIR